MGYTLLLKVVTSKGCLLLADPMAWSGPSFTPTFPQGPGASGNQRELYKGLLVGEAQASSTGEAPRKGGALLPEGGVLKETFPSRKEGARLPLRWDLLLEEGCGV